MSDLGDYEQCTLCEDGAFILARLTNAQGSLESRLKVSLKGPPSADSQARLEQFFALRELLDAPALAQPLSLSMEKGAPVLLLRDPGGIALSSIPSGTLSLQQKLQLGANLAATLKVLHARGVMHKDLRPPKILVDLQSNAVGLTGFGRASKAKREQQAVGPTSQTLASFAYLSPEQTGLINRGVDQRCDLYSLGVVLYELFSSRHPFQASTPMEWLHSHIARQPVPLADVAADVPPVVESIVRRLLAKSAEDRYQTASGVEHDLRRCCDEWSDSKAIEAFELGTRDAPDRLLIPDRLYGREKEMSALIAVLDRVTQSGTPELVFVSGFSGTGKSSLVNELQKSLVSNCGNFVFGKFDQYKRDIPYATLAQSFQRLVRKLTEQDVGSLELWTERLKSALGAHGKLIVDLIPEVELIVGPQPPVPELPPQDAQTRFHSTLTRFIGAFARPECPLILFLDDLQWLDAGTGSWLASMTGASKGHLVIVGAFRDNEVGPGHILTRTLEALRASPKPLNRILLSPLRVGDIGRLVGDTLHIEHADAGALSELVFDKTGGNPLFVVQFLRLFEEEGLLKFDHVTREWNWAIDRIRDANFDGSIVDLMVARISRVNHDTQAVLKQFACLGNTASSMTLASVCRVGEDEIHRRLGEAVEAGMVYERENGYAFIHDRVQEAAYAMIPLTQRAHAHLAIARTLSEVEKGAVSENNVFEIVNQYNRAGNLVEDASEQLRVINFNLYAAHRAKASAAYASANIYLTTATGLLGEDGWSEDYTRKFSIECDRAECEFLTGETTSAATRLEDLASRARDVCDRATVAFLRVTLFTALDQTPAAVETCLQFLKQIGIEWESHPGRDAARTEYERLLRQIGDKPIESLADLSLLTDRNLISTLNVLVAVLPPAFFSDENLVSLVLCRVANLSIEHGNSDASALCYAYLGMVAGPLFGDYQAGFSFGRLGLALVDEKGLDRFKARVYMTFAYHVSPWTQHVRSKLPLLRQAIDVAIEAGDLTYMGFSSCAYINALYTAGEPLATLDREAGQWLSAVKEAKFGLIVFVITAQLLLARKLRGAVHAGANARDRSNEFDDISLEEHELEQRLEADPALSIAACWYWIRKMQWLYFAEDTDGALRASEKARPLLWTSSGHLVVPEFHFFGALTRARAHDAAASGDSKTAHLGALRAHYDMLKIWALHCSSNFGCRAALVEGEIARLEGRGMEAMRCYETAVRLARESDFPHIEALAYDVASRFYQTHDFPEIAVVFNRSARRAYTKWGAFARVDIVEARNPLARRDESEEDSYGNISAGRIDVETVVRASQAISGEMVLDRLVRTLMSIVLEHSGARRAVLVLPHEERLWIEAETAVDGSGVEVRTEHREASGRELPMSLLYQAMRSRDKVLIDDAVLLRGNTGDDYLQITNARSILVFPVVKQTKLMGVLYLENDLTPGAFTPSRIAVLGLLAAQAAISLENATLEAKQALLEEKDALLHEIHHRVKNNLQLISSLLNLQAAKADNREVAELFAESRNRVRSMAMVHENLYRAGNFARIMMAEHVENLCRHLAQAYDIRKLNVELKTEIDTDLQLDMSRAISCGLVINELVSNALKHAFPQGEGGVLTVHFRRHSDAGYQLEVVDNGIGLPAGFSLAEVDTLGLQLVHDLVHQLHGTVEVKSGHGTMFLIRFSDPGN